MTLQSNTNGIKKMHWIMGIKIVIIPEQNQNVTSVIDVKLRMKIVKAVTLQFIRSHNGRKWSMGADNVS